MARRVSRKAHARCRAGENPEIISKGYLSLFVDWAFNNGIGKTVGTGGGTYDQYDHSRKISFAEALPGDIVFFSDLSHVGIYAGLNENGQPIVIQCGSAGVSVTSLSIFSIIARPNILE